MADQRIGDRRSCFVYSKYTFHDNRIVVCDGPLLTGGKTLYDGPERRELTPLFKSFGAVSPKTEFFKGPFDFGPHTE